MDKGETSRTLTVSTARTSPLYQISSGSGRARRYCLYRVPTTHTSSENGVGLAVTEAPSRRASRFPLIPRVLSLLAGQPHSLLLDPVIAAPDALEARFFALGASRQRCLHGFPEQWLPRELLCRRVNLPRPHRVPGLFEHPYHGLEHWAHFGRN